jgi:CheY-like chemotaxis protein
MPINPSERSTILIVEDERPLLEVVQIKLEGSGFDVVTARSVNQALDFLRSLPKVDAIWLDHYLLGQHDGIEFVRQVRSGDERLQRIPIFVISNSASESTEAAYRDLGVEGYYVKSDFQLDEIINDMRSVLYR